MMPLKTFRHLTDREFIRLMRTQTNMSPLVAEFVRRLECKDDNTPAPLSTSIITNQIATACPVCHAQLNAAIVVYGHLSEFSLTKGQ